MFSGFGLSGGGVGANDIVAYIGLQGISQFQRDMDKADGAVKKLEHSFQVSKAAIGVATAGITAAVSVMSVSLVKNTINVAKEFEFLQVRLQRMYNDVNKGNEVFNEFKQLAATTPFELRNVVQAGATLKAMMGDIFKPEFVKIAGDLAAYMGTDIVEAANAMGRAFAGGAGAADILRERGILNLIKTKNKIDDFKNITLEEFRQAMFRTFTDPEAGIAGATDALSKTIVGLESNARDAFTRLQNVIGEKFAPVYKNALHNSIRLTEGFIDLLTDWGRKVEETATRAINAFANIRTVADFGRVISALEEMQKLLIKTGDIKQIQWLAQNFQFITKEQRFALQGAKDMWEGAKILGEIILDLKDRLDKIDDSWKNFNMQLDEVDLKSGKAIKSINKIGEEFEKLSLKTPEPKKLQEFIELWPEVSTIPEVLITGNDPLSYLSDLERRIYDVAGQWEYLGLTIENVNAVMLGGIQRLSHGIAEAMFGTRKKLGDIFKGIAIDFVSLVVEEILKNIAKILVPKILALFAIFDKYQNDRMAERVGRDYARYFTKGALVEFNRNFQPEILDSLPTPRLDNLPVRLTDSEGKQAAIRVEVETVPIPETRVRAYFKDINRKVLIPDLDYVNTFMRTKSGEFD